MVGNCPLGDGGLGNGVAMNVAKHARNPFETQIPQKVRDAMEPNGMQARIASNDLKTVSCGGISGNNGIDLVE